MKYAIYDFSQAELVKFNDSHPNEKLDVIDCMIFRWFTHFAAVPKSSKGHTAMWSKIFDGEIYYWVNYQALIEEFPLFDINTKKSISRRFDKYVAGGLMKKKLYKARNKGSLTFFAFTTEFSKFEYDETNDSQKINPHKAMTDSSEENMPEECDFREDTDVLSKKLERTQKAPLNQEAQLREDSSVPSKKLEKTLASPTLNNTQTKNLNSTTTSPEHNARHEIQENAAEVEAESIITQELKNLFGGHFVFDGNFVSEIRSLLTQFEVSNEKIEAYLKFVFKKASEKKPNSLTNMYYKMAKSGVTMQDFVLSGQNRTFDGEKNMVNCPVCNSKANFYGNCPCCGFSMPERGNDEKVRRMRLIFSLPDAERENFENEYNAELLRQRSFGIGAMLRNPRLKTEFEERIAAIYRKYGILA